jgi:glycosyltransferase involved in cell wall biosynthesis
MTRLPVSVALVMAAPFPALQGSQLLVRQLAEGLARRNHRVHVVAYGATRGALPAAVIVHRIPQVWGCGITASGPRIGKVALDLLLTMKLLAVVRREGVELLHAHNYEAAIASLVVGRMTGRPVVYHGHSAMADELPTYAATWLGRAVATRAGRWLDRQVPCRADYCIGVTPDLVEVLQRRGVDAAAVAWVPPIGRDLRQDVRAAGAGVGESGPTGVPTLLYAGNLDPYQNLEFLLESFSRVRAAHPVAHLLVVTHAEGRRYRRQARRLRQRGVSVVRVRSFPEARGLIARADIVLCPRTEPTGFPMKLLNYMAAGKPVVACAGSAKLLVHGVTGVIVPNDDVGAFAAALIGLLDDAAERRRIGAGARAAVETWCGSDAMLEQVEGIYRRVLAARDRSSEREAVAAQERWV